MEKKNNKGLTPQDISDVIHNPIYAGIYPYEGYVPDKQWIDAAKVAIQKEGADKFFAEMLRVLRNSMNAVKGGMKTLEILDTEDFIELVESESVQFFGNAWIDYKTSLTATQKNTIQLIAKKYMTKPAGTDELEIEGRRVSFLMDAIVFEGDNKPDDTENLVGFLKEMFKVGKISEISTSIVFTSIAC